MKYSKQKLWKDKIRYLFKDGKIYFYIEDIKRKYPLTKIPFEKALKIDSIYVAKSKDIEEMTGFEEFIGNTVMRKNR